MTRPIVLVFPGQGSQKKGMLLEMRSDFPVIEETYREASEVLGFDLPAMIEHDEARLNLTQHAQPALLSASYALWRVLEPVFAEGAASKVSAMAGHSLGEYSALVCAGVLEFSDALRLVHARGKLMQEGFAPGESTMAAVLGLSDDLVESACAEASRESGQVVSAANYNTQGQVVIAGMAKAVELASQKAQALGARRVLPLNVTVASHCALMQKAADGLQELLTKTSFSAPRYPVYPNVFGDRATQDPEVLKSALLSQLTQPVRWTSFLDAAAPLAQAFIECGPGMVLCGLIKRELPSHKAYSASTDAATLQELLNLLTSRESS